MNDPITERLGERTAIAILGALSAVVFFGGVLALVADDDALPAAGARVHLEGRGLLERADGSEDELRDGAVLHPGDEVELQEGFAVLELAGGGTIEVRSGQGDVDDSRLEVGSPSRLLAGDALAQGPAGVTVEAAGTLVTLRDGSRSAARIRRELAVTTATYRGAVELDSAGRSRELPAYRQLSVASVGRTPEEPDPLDVDVSDPWDQRFLGGAIALTRSLESMSTTFTAQGGPRRTAEDFAALLPGLTSEEGFGASLIDAARPAGETLVGAAIAMLAPDGPFDEAWQEIFDFHDDGAEWGLVAFDQRVEEGPVLDEVEAALSRSAQGSSVVAAPTVTPTTASPSGNGGDGDGTPTPTTTSPAGDSGTTPTTAPLLPPPTQPPPTVPPPTAPPIVPELPLPLPEEDQGLLDGLLEPVGGLLGSLLGG